MDTTDPHASGTPEAVAFREATEPVVRALRSRGVKPTRDRVARELHIEPRHLQRLTATLLGIEWSTFARSVPRDEPRTAT